MAIILNNETASEYVIKYFSDKGSAIVTKTIPNPIDGIPVIDVYFTNDGYEGIMSVWYDTLIDELYGEY